MTESIRRRPITGHLSDSLSYSENLHIAFVLTVGGSVYDVAAVTLVKS